VRFPDCTIYCLTAPKADFELLLEVLENFDPLYTVAHILAEVSNLTDLAGI
jgi:hypothetical protein